MNRLLIGVFLLASTVPLYAQAQQPNAAKFKADAQKVVSIISRDKLKAQTYCEIAELNADMAGCLFRKTEVDRSATLFNPSCCENLFCFRRGESFASGVARYVRNAFASSAEEALLMSAAP